MKLTKILENSIIESRIKNINRRIQLVESFARSDYNWLMLFEAIEKADTGWLSRFEPGALTFAEGQYQKYQAGIADALRAYIGNDTYELLFVESDGDLKSVNIPPQKLKILRLFDTVTSIEQLVKVIDANKSDQLFKDLFEISSVTGSELTGAVKSGRGGLGKGEVLCVLLVHNGISGGTDSTDLDGDVKAEIKSTKSKTPLFGVPLGASRVAPWQSQRQLRRLQALIDSVIDAPAYTEFLESIQTLLPKKMKAVSEGKSPIYFFKSSEPIGNINGTELTNLKKFFAGCYLKYYKSKSGVEDDIYLDIDSPDDNTKDVFLKAKLLDPAELASIKKGKKVSFSVTSANKENARLMEVFENKLKQHPYVTTPGAFEAALEADLKQLLKVPFLIFHEDAGLKAPDVLTSNTVGSYKARVKEFTLNQVKIEYNSSEPEE
jgi:hypothetical protein